MTKSQEKKIAEIKGMIPHFDYYGEDYEVKKWEVTDGYAGIIFLYFETGKQGDEGTMAEVFCRKIRHCIIGRRGGIQTIGYLAPHFNKNVSAFVFMNECAYH